MSFNVINGDLYVLGESFFSGSITGSGDLSLSGSIYLQTTPITGSSSDFLIYNQRN
jgi:hypothetical protein